MWHRVGEKAAPQGEIVLALTPGGDVRELRFQDNLWWLPDMSMYVYFTPTHWKRLGS